MTTFIVIENHAWDSFGRPVPCDPSIYRTDTEAEISEAREALRNAGIEQAPIYSGDPESDDSVKTAHVLFAAETLGGDKAAAVTTTQNTTIAALHDDRVRIYSRDEWEAAIRKQAALDVVESVDEGADYSRGWGDLDAQAFDLSPWHGQAGENDAWAVYQDAWRAEWLSRAQEVV